MNRTRGAHDFATIRARMEGLRREREGAESTEKAMAAEPATVRATGLVGSRLPSGV